MSVENVKKFIDLIKSSEEVKAELKELCKIEDKVDAGVGFCCLFGATASKEFTLF